MKIFIAIHQDDFAIAFTTKEAMDNFVTEDGTRSGKDYNLYEDVWLVMK